MKKREILYFNRMQHQVSILLVFVAISALGCSEQGAPDAALQLANDQITSLHDSTVIEPEYLGEKLNPIRKYVAKLDSKRREWSLVIDKPVEIGLEKGIATYFVWNKAIQKIVVKSIGAKLNWESNYYFNDNELVYSYEMKMDKTSEDESFEIKTESFFEGKLLIRSIDNQDCGAPYNRTYLEEEQKRIEVDVKLIRETYSTK